MTIHLPPELENSLRAVVQSGHFASVDDAMAEAARRLLSELLGRSQVQVQPTGAASDGGPGSFLGSMRDDADELDEIVADAYRKRREETWRDVFV